MEFLKLLVELLKTLAWPGLIVWLAYWYRGEIRALVPRLKKVGLSGAEFNEASGQVVENVRQSIDTKSLHEFEGMPRTPVMEEVEKSILRDVNLIEPDKRIPLLARHLAQGRLEVAFERVYSFIFGSQIEGLKELTKAGGRVPLSDAHRFFDSVKERFPAFYEKSSFGEWFSYLAGSGLAVIDNGAVQITLLGREFLLYLEARGLPLRNW